jgi:hypothetical protein
VRWEEGEGGGGIQMGQGGESETRRDGTASRLLRRLAPALDAP